MHIYIYIYIYIYVHTHTHAIVVLTTIIIIMFITANNYHARLLLVRRQPLQAGAVQEVDEGAPHQLHEQLEVLYYTIQYYTILYNTLLYYTIC